MDLDRARTMGGGQERDAASQAPAHPSAQPRARPKPKRKTWWLKQLHTWHWVSAAISLIGMMGFAITGITLNHAASIGATPIVTNRSATLPPPLVDRLKGQHGAGAPLPDVVASAVRQSVGLDAAGRAVEWSDGEAYVALPGPGRDAWVSIDRRTGAITAEKTARGWVSYLNDLHKGRNSGVAWFWFIDAFAIACVVFTITGLLLLQLHARHRPSTWPLVAIGLAIPAAIAVIFIH